MLKYELNVARLEGLLCGFVAILRDWARWDEPTLALSRFCEIKAECCWSPIALLVMLVVAPITSVWLLFVPLPPLKKGFSYWLWCRFLLFLLKIEVPWFVYNIPDETNPKEFSELVSMCSSLFCTLCFAVGSFLVSKPLSKSLKWTLVVAWLSELLSF